MFLDRLPGAQLEGQLLSTVSGTPPLQTGSEPQGLQTSLVVGQTEALISAIAVAEIHMALRILLGGSQLLGLCEITPKVYGGTES